LKHYKYLSIAANKGQLVTHVWQKLGGVVHFDNDNKVQKR